MCPSCCLSLSPFPAVSISRVRPLFLFPSLSHSLNPSSPIRRLSPPPFSTHATRSSRHRHLPSVQPASVPRSSSTSSPSSPLCRYIPAVPLSRRRQPRRPRLIVPPPSLIKEQRGSASARGSLPLVLSSSLSDFPHCMVSCSYSVSASIVPLPFALRSSSTDDDRKIGRAHV